MLERWGIETGCWSGRWEDACPVLALIPTPSQSTPPSLCGPVCVPSQGARQNNTKCPPDHIARSLQISPDAASTHASATAILSHLSRPALPCPFAIPPRTPSLPTQHNTHPGTRMPHPVFCQHSAARHPVISSASLPRPGRENNSTFASLPFSATLHYFTALSPLVALVLHCCRTTDIFLFSSRVLSAFVAPISRYPTLVSTAKSFERPSSLPPMPMPAYDSRLSSIPT